MLWLSVLAILAGAAGEPASQALAPIDRWNVEYGAYNCRLSRSFGNQNGNAMLVFTMPPLRPDQMGLFGIKIIVSPKTSLPRKGVVGLAVEPTHLRFDGSFGNLETVDGNRLILPSIGGVTPTIFMGAKEIAFQFAGDNILSFDMASARAAFGSLETCRRALVNGWKIDPDEYLKVKTWPTAIGDEAMVIGSGDYPRSARGASGTTRVHWTIDAEGKSVDCVVDISSGNEALDSAACRAIETKARYRPAIGFDGLAIATHKNRSVLWHAQ